MKTTQPKRQQRRRVRWALAMVGVGMSIAACGSSGTQVTGGGATTATGNASPINLSRCMRSHGAPNFPDPVMSSGGEGFPGGLLQEGDGSMVVDGVSLSGPALHSAEKACSQYLSPKGPPPKLSASQRLTALKLAQCMRAHGVPNFPDPAFSGGGRVNAGPGAGINPQSPAFQNAANVCGHGRLRLTG